MVGTRLTRPRSRCSDQGGKTRRRRRGTRPRRRHRRRVARDRGRRALADGAGRRGRCLDRDARRRQQGRPTRGSVRRIAPGSSSSPRTQRGCRFPALPSTSVVSWGVWSWSPTEALPCASSTACCDPEGGWRRSLAPRTRSSSPMRHSKGGKTRSATTMTARRRKPAAGTPRRPRRPPPNSGARACATFAADAHVLVHRHDRSTYVDFLGEYAESELFEDLERRRPAWGQSGTKIEAAFEAGAGGRGGRPPSLTRPARIVALATID